MGVDYLDMTFRLEKAFQLKWHRHYELRLVQERPNPKARLTAGEVHDFVCKLLQEENRPIPHSSWHRVQKVVAEVARKRIREIRPTSRLVEDLEMT